MNDQKLLFCTARIYDACELDKSNNRIVKKTIRGLFPSVMQHIAEMFHDAEVCDLQLYFREESVLKVEGGVNDGSSDV